MTDLADEAKEELTFVMAADDKPVVVNPKEEAARTHECEYCGHDPCGCGG